MTLRILAAALAMAVTTALAGALPAAAKSDAPPDASPAEVKRLEGEFRGALKEPEKRAEIVQSAIQAGPAAAAGVMSVIQHELRPEVTRYTTKFSREAAALAQKRSSGVRREEVSKLRGTVLGLSKLGPDFTHQTIVAKGDPAMKRLRAMFVVSRTEVLDATPALQTDRRTLIESSALWEQCATCVYNHMKDDAQKPRQAPSFERYLQGEEELAALLAGAVDTATRNTLTSNAGLAAKLDHEEASAILALNITRMLLGLPALAIDLKLCDAARDDAQDMEKLKFFAHESPVEGKKTPWDRARRMGTSASAENIFCGCQDGPSANLGWFHSPGHHVNMLAAHHRVGIGRAGGYFVEMFGD